MGPHRISQIRRLAIVVEGGCGRTLMSPAMVQLPWCARAFSLNLDLGEIRPYLPDTDHEWLDWTYLPQIDQPSRVWRPLSCVTRLPECSRPKAGDTQASSYCCKLIKDNIVSALRKLQMKDDRVCLDENAIVKLWQALCKDYTISKHAPRCRPGRCTKAHGEEMDESMADWQQTLMRRRQRALESVESLQSRLAQAMKDHQKVDSDVRMLSKARMKRRLEEVDE